jgi:ketosteroid isomerase-like protein
MTQIEQNVKLAEQLLEVLASQDLDHLATLFTADAEYTDVATPTDDVAYGGAEVAQRLGLAFEGVEISNRTRNLVANDHAVMIERVERWGWKTGEVLDLEIATILEITDTKVSRWVDYWDMQTFLGAAPGWWIEQVMKGWKN